VRVPAAAVTALYNLDMTEPAERTPGPDDTAAFQRFYAEDRGNDGAERGLIYRLFVGWWRDRT
jgi:hypothetical protein